jgi:putative ABC transport system permease protein
MLTDAVRSLRHARGLSAFIVAILTIVIAAATVTFSVVDAVVLRPLPFPAPGRLIAIDHQRGDALSQVRTFSAADYLAIREHLAGAAAVAAVARNQLTLRNDDGTSEKVFSARVTASLWDVLAVRPALGTTFDATAEAAGAVPVAVIGHALWTRRFGQDPAAIGRTLNSSTGQLRIIGVMPESFGYPLSDERLAEVWTPYVIPPDERSGQQPSSYLHVLARVRDDAAVATIQPSLDGLRDRLRAANPQRYPAAARFAVLPLSDWMVGPVKGWMLLVLVAIGLLLLVACANVANLLLSRALVRMRELSIRSALGATRGRLIATLLLESAILSAAAVGLALLAAWWGIETVRHALPPGIARAHTIALNWRVFAAAVGATVVTAALVGVLPAVHAVRHDLVAALKDNAATVAGSRGGWRSAVLVSEMALTVVLLVATTLFVSSFVRLVRADLGFDRSRLLLVSSVGSIQGSAALFVEHLKSMPGIVEVGGDAINSPPLVRAGFGGGATATRLTLPAAPAGSGVAVSLDRVTPGYLAAAGIPLLRGRTFVESDMAASFKSSDLAKADVAVIDEIAARQLFGNADPIGREIRYGSLRASVIGVVAHVKLAGAEDDAPPQAYFPGATAASHYSYLVRTSGDPAPLIPRLTAAIAPLRGPADPPLVIRPVEDAFRNITARRRFTAQAMGTFAILALLIGASGVYAVMSSLVAQRTREIGVRLALGATPRRMLSDVLRQIGRQLAVGLAIGFPTAWLVVRGFESLFFGVRATDPATYVIVAVGLVIVGLAAALVPARRASRVDPLIALRSE